jgi:hypothetical protein
MPDGANRMNDTAQNRTEDAPTGKPAPEIGESQSAAIEKSAPQTARLGADNDASSKKIQRHLLALGVIALILCLMNYQLVLHASTHVVGRPFEDAFDVLWQLSWMDTAVFEKGVNPFFSPDVFYPHGWYLASSAQSPWYLLLLAPVTHLLGATLTYNMLLLGTYLLAAFGVYLLLSRHTTNRFVGIIAGFAYIGAPVLLIRLGGHLNILFSAAFLPFTIVFLNQALANQERRRMWTVLAGIALALTILGHWSFLFIATLPLIGYFMLAPSTMSRGQRVRTGLLVSAIAFVLVAPFAYLAWNARAEMFPGEGDFPVADVNAYGISPDYLLAGNSEHPLLGELSQSVFPLHGEQDAVGLGTAALILAIVGLFKNPWSNTKPFVAMGLISFVLALGLTLHWHAGQVLLRVGPAIEQLYDTLVPMGPTLPAGYIAIPLPALLLYRFIPFADSMRVWSRFVIPLTLSVALLAGLGLRTLLRQGTVVRLAAVFLGLLVIFEGVRAPYEHFTEVATNQRTADLWLAEQPSGTKLIEYPLPIVNKNAMYSQSVHGQQIVNGFMSIQPSFLQEASEQLGTWPDKDAVSLLREWGVQYMVLNGHAGSELQEKIIPVTKQLPGVCLTQTFEDGFMGYDRTYLFELRDAGEPCDK